MGLLYDSLPAKVYPGMPKGNQGQEMRPYGLHKVKHGMAWGRYKGQGKDHWPTGNTGQATRGSTTNEETGKREATRI